MTQSVIHGKSKEAPQTRPATGFKLNERWLRQGSAILILYLLLQAELGLAWDRKWHDLVGRDQFWIPPHILMYTGLGCAGIVALIMVLVDTVRYNRKREGVNDISTIPVLRYFHAPLGFVLLGFGALTDLLSAPLDNYWHELYGLDVTLWSPFHIMGTIGGVILGLGAAYMLASEAAHERQKGAASWRILGLSGPEWCMIVMLAAFIELALPALTAFTPMTLNSMSIETYSLPLTLGAATFLVAIVQTTRKPGTASLTVLTLFVLALGTQIFVPWALWDTVARLGFTFRFADQRPLFNVTLVLLPLIFLIGATCIDLAAYWQWRDKTIDERKSLKDVWLLGAITALPTVFLPALIVRFLQLFPGLTLPFDVLLILRLDLSSILPMLPIVLVVGALIAMLGTAFGDIWHLSKQ